LKQSGDTSLQNTANLVYNGFWFSPGREALQALVTESQRDVSGLVRLKLYKGNVNVAGRKSFRSLYDPTIATMESDAGRYDPDDATGFIRLNALRLKLRAAMQVGVINLNSPDLRPGFPSTLEFKCRIMAGKERRCLLAWLLKSKKRFS
jgi:argininosuccinate synthase